MRFWKQHGPSAAWGEAQPDTGLSRQELETLAMYNAERARGLLHAEEWQVKMAELQRRFDDKQVLP